MKKVLIVGGVAGGATTAARLRRLDEKAQIIMFERGSYVSFANCGLPYYIGGAIKERENLFVMTPEKLKQRLDIDVRVQNEVVSIDRTARTVEVRDIANNRTYRENYDVLVLSPGAEPLRPPIQGIDKGPIFTLRNVPDTDAIKNYIDTRKPRRAVVVGAGFIGLEMAENLHHLGIQVTIVEMADQVMAPIDFEMAAAVHQHLKSKKVEFYLNDGVTSFVEEGENRLRINLKSGRALQADMVILSIGVRPESGLAKAAGLELTERGAIIVNEYLQTSDPAIYALGDAIAFRNPVTGQVMNTLLAGPANRQGRILADNIVKTNTRKYRGAINTAIAKVFDITVASTGMAEKHLKAAGIEAASYIIHAGNHAGYYPGAIPLTLKLIFSPKDGKVLGAQAVGYEGVDKRIDMIASVLSKGGTIYDLQEIEHAYAPPYSSAKDPVNIAGYIAENMIDGLVKVITWKELISLDRSNVFLLDVRTKEEHALGSIDGAVNIPVDDLRGRLNEIPRNKSIVVFCAVGLRGYLAYRILVQNGYSDVKNLSGGYKTFEYTITPQANENLFAADVVGTDDMIYQKTSVPLAGVGVAPVLEVDACGLQCPGPILRLKKESDNLGPGQSLLIKATDQGFKKDVASWCRMVGNQLLELSEDKGVISAIVLKPEHPVVKAGKEADGHNKTIVVFSDDFDRALASFVIANGAVSTGKKVTMFFTFWGLNLLKKSKKPRVKKDFMGKMFGMMLPSDSKDLKLSKMNMFGMGTVMMRKIMKSKNIESLEDMMRAASEAGVEMIACQMSMDVMGVKKEEMFDFVTVGGVATYLEAADDSNLNLFI